MNREDMEREILKVTQQGGMARVPETTVAEAMGNELSEEERETEVGYWTAEFCEEHNLITEQKKDIFGMVEVLFQHPLLNTTRIEEKPVLETDNFPTY